MKKAIRYIVESLFDDEDNDIVNYDPENNIITKTFHIDANTNDKIKLKILNDVPLHTIEKQYLNSIVSRIVVKNENELVKLCLNCIFTLDITNLNFINTKNVTSLYNFYLYISDFGYISKSIDISQWDVSNVTDMSFAFAGYSKFNCDLSRWNVSYVTDMRCMFRGCSEFNCNLNKWDVLHVDNMMEMFSDCTSFNGDITTWDVRYCHNFRRMFYNCKSFKQDLSDWKIRSNSLVNLMFAGTDYPVETLKFGKTLKTKLNKN